MRYDPVPAKYPMTPPRTFGRYRIDAPLGGGGMGTTYRATLVGAHGFERRVALKVIRADHTADPTARKLFLDEARLLSALHHPNIACALDSGDHHGEHYIALEYVDGVDLERLIAHCAAGSTRIPADVACYIAACTARALHYAHNLTAPSGAALDIVHRDVTPPNILLDVNGHVKLSDFGIALNALRDKHTRTGVMRGHPRYVSPEHLTSTTDNRSDLFSLGVVLYELLAGFNPFRADIAEASVLAIREGRRDPLHTHCPNLPRPLLELVEDLLHPRKELRPASGAVVEERLAPYVHTPSTPRTLAQLVRNAAHGVPDHPVTSTSSTARAIPVARPQATSKPSETPTDPPLLGTAEGLQYEPATSSTPVRVRLVVDPAETPDLTPTTTHPLRRHAWALGGAFAGLLAATTATVAWTMNHGEETRRSSSLAAPSATKTPAREAPSHAAPAPPPVPLTVRPPMTPLSEPAPDAGPEPHTSPAQLGTSTLEIEVLDWGYVWLDGIYRGEARTFRGLQPGPHVVGLTTTPNAPAEKTHKIVLKPGSTRKTYEFNRKGLQRAADITH